MSRSRVDVHSASELSGCTGEGIDLRTTDPFLACSGLVLTWVECLVFLAVCWVGLRPGATRNAWVGLRIGATMDSDLAWAKGHRAALPKALMACILVLPASLIAILFVNHVVLLVTIFEWVCVVAGLIWLLGATAGASRAAREVGTP